MIKKYDRVRYREKFRRYRIVFFIFLLAFAVSFVGELFLFGNMEYAYQAGKVEFFNFFSDVFTVEALALLALFLFGVTLYAPVFGFAFSVGRGAFTAFCLAVMVSGLGGSKGIWLFILCFLYLILSAWLFLAYAAFCSTTAIRIFSDPTKRKRGENAMFGGSLFYSSFFQGSINLRFLFSYILLMLGAVGCSLVLTLAFSALRSIF